MPLRSIRVEVSEGPDAGKAVVSESASISIGTAPGNDLVLSDDTVSRYHLELTRSDDRIMLEDHGSTNGVLLGGSLVERAKLAPGTTIQVGRNTLSVQNGEVLTVPLADEERIPSLKGRTPVMRQLIARVDKASQSDASVLIVGETGTGKEVIAQAIHQASARKDEPFVIVDCGALIPNLIASELFGHERGAFTGADKKHVGAFENANGGTLFL